MAPRISSHEGASIPLPGQVISVMLSLAATTVLTLFLTQRLLVIKAWNRLPLVVWLVFAIYIDSYIFVVATAVLQHSLGVNSSMGLCEAAIILCLVCYVTTKFIYVFLAEKAYIIRNTTKPRMKSKLYLVNSFGMLSIYIAVVIINFIFRITRMESGQCIIGMRSVAMIPLISFDTVVNVYLTIMFLIPLKNLYSFSNMPRTRANLRLRMVAFRTFCGAICTLVSSIVNLSVLMALDGEPGWVCLMCCNCDILFSAIVIQWVTSKDNAGTFTSTTSSRDCGPPRDHGSGPTRITTPPSALHTIPTSTSADISLMPTRTRTQSQGTSFDDQDENDTLVGAAQKHANSTSMVVVTTTIEHESTLFDDEVKDSPANFTRFHEHGCTGSMGPSVRDNSYVVSQTRITAGSPFLEGLDRKRSPSCCKISRIK